MFVNLNLKENEAYILLEHIGPYSEGGLILTPKYGFNCILCLKVKFNQTSV